MATAAQKKRGKARSAEAQAKMDIKFNWKPGRKKKAQGTRKKKTGYVTGGGF